MIAELAPWAIGLALTLIGGGVGWSQIQRHGEAKEERDVARKEAEKLRAVVRGLIAPLESDDEFSHTLERLLDDDG